MPARRTDRHALTMLLLRVATRHSVVNKLAIDSTTTYRRVACHRTICDGERAVAVLHGVGIGDAATSNSRCIIR